MPAAVSALEAEIPKVVRRNVEKKSVGKVVL